MTSRRFNTYISLQSPSNLSLKHAEITYDSSQYVCSSRVWRSTPILLLGVCILHLFADEPTSGSSSICTRSTHSLSALTS